MPAPARASTPTPAPAPAPARRPNPLASAQPTRHIFDPWNSSSTGHQRADNRLAGSTSWRDSRTAKLGEQFTAGLGGGKRRADAVGAGSEGWGVDGRLENGAYVRGAAGLRSDGQQSLWDCMQKRSTKPGLSVQNDETSKRRKLSSNDAKLSRNSLETARAPASRPNHEALRPVTSIIPTIHDNQLSHSTRSPSISSDEPPPSAQPPRELSRSDGRLSDDRPAPSPEKPKQIFRNLTFYINGSTFPLVSDHRLKRLLAERGARLSITLARRTVTHVVLGHPNASGGTGGAGAGGGLSASKLQKEIANVAGKGVKFVSAQWVLDCVAAGVRVPEHAYAPVKLASARQGSVLGMFGAKGAGVDSTKDGRSV